MSTKRSHAGFYRGFGSVISLMPARPRVRVGVIDVERLAARDLAEVWCEVGEHLKGAMDELGKEGKKRCLEQERDATEA